MENKLQKIYTVYKSLPEKENFYCHLNKENITDADYAPAKRVCKYFEIKKLGE